MRANPAKIGAPELTLVSRMHALIDIGANLAHDSFDEDRDAVLQRAAARGLEHIVITGSSDASNRRAAELAAAAPGFLSATAGVHPHHASDYTSRSDAQIRDLCARDAVVAVGECGLDYFRNFSPREDQLAAFRHQLTIAIDLQLPVFLHQRDAHDDFVAEIAPRISELTRAVAHCFTGDKPMLEAYLDLGLYIGITGWICDERRGAHLHDIVAMIPDDRLLIETDSPYLLPRSIRPRPKSRRNEPMHLVEVLATLASARGQSEEHVAAITTDNARRFFYL